MRKQLSQPSFTNGFARSKGESVRPDLWGVNGFFPIMRPYGLDVPDLFARRNITPTAAQWANQSYYMSSIDQGIPIPSPNITGPWTVFLNYNMVASTGMIMSDGIQTSTAAYFSAATSLRFYLNSTYLGRIDGVQNVTVGFNDIAFIWDGATIKLWINGTYYSFANAPGTTTLNISYLFYSNSTGGTEYHGNGYVKHVSVYPFALPYNMLKMLSKDPLLPLRRRAAKPTWLISSTPPASNIPVIMNHRRLIGVA